jgi:alkylhydroperoxidase family enzyme
MGTKNDPGAFDCHEHAEPDEPMFTLIARDRCAPATVRVWATLRENRLRASDVECTPGEVMAELDQIAEARACADAMEVWRTEHR